jgi:hypothetical protein
MSVCHKALGRPTFETVHQYIWLPLKYILNKLQRTFTWYMLLGNTHWTLECSAVDVGWPNCTVCGNYFKSSPLLHIFYSREKFKCSIAKNKPAKCFLHAAGYQSGAGGQIAPRNGYQMIARLDSLLPGRYTIKSKYTVKNLVSDDGLATNYWEKRVPWDQQLHVSGHECQGLRR